MISNIQAKPVKCYSTGMKNKSRLIGPAFGT
jgi:hypothetical protein